MVGKKAVYIELESKKGQLQKGQEGTSKHCDTDGHMDEKCWKLHLELCPKKHKSKKGADNATTETKETMVDTTSDLDEAVVCTTLQQPRASGEMNALF